MESLWAHAWDDGCGSDWVLCYYNPTWDFSSMKTELPTPFGIPKGIE